MNVLRLWFVVLLALLLPMRGVMGATLPCAPGAMAAHGGPAAAGAGGTPAPGHLHHLHPPNHAQHAHAHAAVQGPTFGVEAAVAAHSAAEGEDQGAAAPSAAEPSSAKCNLCAASCASPSMPSAFAGLPTPTTVTQATFPVVSAPAATFQSGGPERPPRPL